MLEKLLILKQSDCYQQTLAIVQRSYIAASSSRRNQDATWRVAFRPPYKQCCTLCRSTDVRRARVLSVVSFSGPHVMGR